jgi:3'-phosphoadenosine 5'-phosphosulfate sulfotransferase (PAPS reductase)/FAD synthetase
MSQDTLFSAASIYAGDPLRPDMRTVTPAEIVMELSPADRIRRVEFLIEQSLWIVTDALTTHLRGREVVAVCGLWSGGRDSNTLMHLVRHLLTHVIHAIPGPGIEATHQFVRDAAAAWDLPLIEGRPPEGATYEDLVLGRVTDRAGKPVWGGGFPGPAAHYLMVQRLKERIFDWARHVLGVANSKTKVALYIAGRRRDESEERKDVPEHEADGSVIWISPLVMWTAPDLMTYRQIFDDVPVNWVAELLHMSGECLCGSNAKRGELDFIEQFFPTDVAPIRDLERRARDQGIPHPFCRWGFGATRTQHERGSMPRPASRLCGNCRARDALFGLTDECDTSTTEGNAA